MIMIIIFIKIINNNINNNDKMLMVKQPGKNNKSKDERHCGISIITIKKRCDIGSKLLTS